MEFIFFLGGLLLGILIMRRMRNKEKIHGVVDIDHRTEQCVFHITSNEMSDRKKKIAVFYINHDAEISQE